MFAELKIKSQILKSIMHLKNPPILTCIRFWIPFHDFNTI